MVEDLIWIGRNISTLGLLYQWRSHSETLISGLTWLRIDQNVIAIVLTKTCGLRTEWVSTFHKVWNVKTLPNSVETCNFIVDSQLAKLKHRTIIFKQINIEIKAKMTILVRKHEFSVIICQNKNSLLGGEM
mgnify:CR=1 FL=1